MIVTTTIGTATHGNDPSWMWHLVIDLQKKIDHWNLHQERQSILKTKKENLMSSARLSLHYSTTCSWSYWMNLSQGRCHLIGDSASNQNAVSLAWTGSEYYSKTVHIISGSSKVHHFHSTAGKTKRQGPQGCLDGNRQEIIKTFWR